MPSQTEATARPTALKPRETGPAPLRTARGAGRRADAPERPRPFEAGLGLRVLRDRVLEPFALRLFAALREAVERAVLELRDPGGEDVRVAMVRPYGHATPVTGTT